MMEEEVGRYAGMMRGICVGSDDEGQGSADVKARQGQRVKSGKRMFSG